MRSSWLLQQQTQIYKNETIICEKHFIYFLNIAFVFVYITLMFFHQISNYESNGKNAIGKNPLTGLLNEKKWFTWTVSDHERTCSHHSTYGITTLQAKPAPTLRMGHFKREDVRHSQQLHATRSFFPQYTKQKGKSSVPNKKEKK